MSLKLQCPHPDCGKSYRASAEHVGRKVRCPACQREMTIGDAGASEIALNSDPALKDTVRAGANESGETQLDCERIGRFEIREQLGAGAFGEVFRAHDRTLDREVALKVPRASTVGSARAMDRFLREAKAAAQLHHPHIVPVYDAGQADGRYYIASAFISGQPLSELIADGPMECRRAATIVRALADALAYAHEQGIVHRDIKPDNIMLDQSGQPHIMDFGLARFQESTDKVTQDGTVLGTAAYMPPEQARGDLDQVGPASDQYSLGVVLYELLTGQTPFSGPPQVVLFHVLETEPPAPRNLRKLIPPDLETICLRAMAKEPDKRYHSCHSLSEDLRRYLEDEPIAARRLTKLERFVRWRRRNPQVAGLTVALFCALVLGVTISTLLAFQSARRASLAQQEAQRADGEATRAGQEADAARLAQSQARTAADRAKSAADAARVAEAATKTEAQAARQAEKLAKSETERAKLLEAKAADALRQSRQREYDASLMLARTDWEQRNLSRLFDLLQNQIPSEGEPDLRGFEWNYLWSQSRADSRTLEARRVDRMAFDKDRNRLVSLTWGSSGSADQVVIRDLTTGELLPDEGVRQTAKEHSRLAITADGRWVAVMDETNTVSLRELSNGQEKLKLQIGQGPNSNLALTRFRVAISPNGQRLATSVVFSGADWAVQLWDMENGAELGTSRGSGKTAHYNLAFNPTGELLVSCGGESGLTVWSGKTLEELRTLKGHTKAVVFAVFSPDGRWLASGGSDASVRLWNVKAGWAGSALPEHVGGLRDVTFSPDSRQIASAADRSVRVWDIADKVQRRLFHHSQLVTCVAMAPDGERVIAASGGQKITFWPLAAAAAPVLEGRTWMSFSADDQQLAAGHRSEAFKIWDLQTGQVVRSANDGWQYSNLGTFSPDGKYLAYAGKAGSVIVRDATTNEIVFKHEGRPMTSVKCISFAPGGGRMLCSDFFESINVFDIPTASTVWSKAGGGLAGFGPDGEVVVAAKSPSIDVWNAATGEAISTTRSTLGGSDIAFHPKSPQFVAADFDGTAKIWDFASNEQIMVLKGHIGRILQLTYSPDGKRIATAGQDKTVRLWNAANGQELLTVNVASDENLAIAFNRKGDRLAIASADEIRLFDAPIVSAEEARHATFP